jgi:ribosome hibernation promoting factor
MQITVTFRHVEPTPALRQHAEEKLARIAKYLRRPGDAHVILSVAKDRHSAEIEWQADHMTLFAKEVTHDLYSAIDLAVEKLEHQAQKLKTRRAEHKGGESPRGADEPDALALDGAPRRARVVPGRAVGRKPMSVDDALAMLERGDDVFVVFTNEADEQLAVLYRRRDGDFGLITR